MEAASDHQQKAGCLLDFTIKLKEPERKKRKYKRKVTLAEEVNVKKSKGLHLGSHVSSRGGAVVTD
ncbi:hypothetical protein MKW98_011088, partial [Papaver atlanticum]